jgi:tetratricopeptide (TPR) repeat protein
MKRIVIITLFFSLPILFSCKSNNAYQPNLDIPVNSFYLDTSFPSPYFFKVESEQEIFMLDDEMIAMVENKLKSSFHPKKKAMRLLKHIFSQEKIALSYSSHANLTARETYHSHKANCMSLTIMAYALAERAKLKVEFQQVDVPEYWVRNKEYNLLTGHINLLIKPTASGEKNIIFGNDNIEIDFDPFVVKQTFPKKVIEKNTVLAMFYNNKGGQALVDKEYDVAYQYFKAATQTDMMFSPAWGNLAVLYRLTGNLTLAEKVYRYAIQISPQNLTALTNLAILLRSQQNHLEADEIESQLLIKRRKNPYYHAVLGDEAYYKHDYQQALQHYKKAIKLNSKIHELYFGVAKVYYQMNRLSEAKKAMQKALRLNRSKSTEHQYLAKLNFLKAEITN